MSLPNGILYIQEKWLLLREIGTDFSDSCSEKNRITADLGISLLKTRNIFLMPFPKAKRDFLSLLLYPKCLITIYDDSKKLLSKFKFTFKFKFKFTFSILHSPFSSSYWCVIPFFPRQVHLYLLFIIILS